MINKFDMMQDIERILVTEEDIHKRIREENAKRSIPPEKPVTEVVAALIWDGDRFLACQRPESKARGGLWEFVGGKVEPGETKRQALIRECREELGITVSVGEAFLELTHSYPDLTIQLTVFHASIAEGTPRLLEHQAMRWVTAKEAETMPFCPADREIIERLKRI